MLFASTPGGSLEGLLCLVMIPKLTAVRRCRFASSVSFAYCLNNWNIYKDSGFDKVYQSFKQSNPPLSSICHHTHTLILSHAKVIDILATSGLLLHAFHPPSVPAKNSASVFVCNNLVMWRVPKAGVCLAYEVF